MSRKVEKTVYLFDELSERAKERARDWFRRCILSDTFWSETSIDESTDLLNACGFRPSTARRTGAHGYALQWDTNPIDASFDATWSASRLRANAGELDKILADRPNDKNLGVIAKGLRSLAGTYPDSTGAAQSGHRGIYQTSDFEVNADYDENLSDEDVVAKQEFAEIVGMLAHHLATSIYAEYEYVCSDAYADEGIVANEYEFDEDGNRYSG